MESIKKGGRGRGANSDHIMQKRKNATIKPKKGQMASTVVAKVMFNDDEDGDACWDALITWKQANFKDVHIYSGNLLDIVKQVKRLVCDGLIDLMGRVQEVDVIFKLPMIDHKITLTFKEAMKTVEWQERPLL